MSGTLVSWAEAFTPGTSVLLVVDSAPEMLDEIDRTVTRIERSSGLASLSVVAPMALTTWLLERGIDRARLLSPRLEGLDLEFDHFLESDVAVRWAVRRRAALLLGSQPYAPGNREVKPPFERRVAPMLGEGRFVAHSLPEEAVCLLAVDELWHRAGRPEALEQHRRRVGGFVDRLYEAWQQAQSGEISATVPAWEAPGPASPQGTAAEHEARAFAYRQINAALLHSARPAEVSMRLIVDPPGAIPVAGWLPETLQPFGKPEYKDPALKWHRTRLVARGKVGGPYAYLLKSRPIAMKAGDAFFADGRLFKGGVTIGLESRETGQWAVRADIIDFGPFVAVAVAPKAGTYHLVVANHIKGEDHRTGLVLHRFGLASAR